MAQLRGVMGAIFVTGAATAILLAGGAALAAPAPEGADPAPPIQRPSTLGESPTDQPEKPAEPAPPAAEPDAGGGDAGGPPAANPAPPAEAEGPAEPPAEPESPPADEAAPDKEPAFDDGLMAPSKQPTAKPLPPRRVMSSEERARQQDEANARAHRELFRPQGNPTRFNLLAHGLFLSTGNSGSTVSGRMGGASVDLGQSWNHVGYALTLSGFGGSVLLPRETGSEINALLGGGPTLTYGRLALLGRGILDLRLGYDFYTAVTNRVSDSAAVKPQGEGQVVAVEPPRILPHGPRIRLHMALMSQSTGVRRFFHGFGFGLGYQMLVGSLGDSMPRSHVLTVGLTYWMG